MIMLSCREAARLQLQGEDRRLSWVERLKLRLHQRACGNCQRFAAQVELMRHASARWRKYTQE